MARNLLVALVLLSACSMPETGETTVCVSSDGAVLADDSEEFTFSVSGTMSAMGDATGFSSSLECYGTPERSFTVEGADGTAWTVAYAIRDESGASVTPTIEDEVQVGDAVNLTYRHIRSFGSASGFALSDERGLVAAVEQGTWGPALRAEDVPTVSVSSGGVVGETEEECGSLEHAEIVFADEVVAPFDSRRVMFDSPYEVWAVANTTWQRAECTDLAGDWMWAAFRTYWID